LGGSSTINGMVYIRGNARDYDHWAALGNKGWGYTDVLPYFKKSMHQERGESAYHGINGPLNVQDPKWGHELFDTFIAAGKEIGIPYNRDFNGVEQEGVGPYQLTIKNSRRCSVATGYLGTIKNRKNLMVKTQVLVTGIVLENGVAVGVRYLEGGCEKELRANAEVLLCAGTVQSPHLLQLSGIGDAGELAELGIDVKVNLPGVGKNLQDHLDASIQYFCTKSITLDKQAMVRHKLVSLFQYLFLKRGPGISNGLEAGAFVKSDPSLDLPDIQYHFVPAFMLDHARVPGPGDGMMLHGCMLRPKSRGLVALKSANPRDLPVIRPGYLSHSGDVSVMVKVVKIARKIFAAKAFDSYRGAEYFPGQEVQTDQEIEAFIRKTGETIYHPVGTCKMGQDTLAVVDNELRVKGVGGLRVVDASVMPTLIGGNTNAPTVMIAEKAADMILGNKLLSMDL